MTTTTDTKILLYDGVLGINQIKFLFEDCLNDIKTQQYNTRYYCTLVHTMILHTSIPGVYKILAIDGISNFDRKNAYCTGNGGKVNTAVTWYMISVNNFR